MKIQTVYTCQSCGAKAPKLLGRCPQCGEWGTYIEEVVSSPNTSTKRTLTTSLPPQKLQDIQTTAEIRISTLNAEFDRVLGGGIVAGSLVLIGGEPGIGKSTLALQVAMQMTDKTILYVSGEESLNQLRMRAQRLSGEPQNLYLVSETSVEKILEYVHQLKPELVVIDSIQTVGLQALDSTIGSVGQIRESASQIMHTAKETNIPFIIVGHITKDGTLAGPKVLEHMVDTVLLFEGDQHYMYRILRSQKNRFGSTSELGIFEMRQDGLRQVSNPSELLLSQNHNDLSGIAIAAAIEGVRPFLIEVQAFWIKDLHYP